MIIPKWLFQELFVNIPRKLNNPKLFKQIARENSRRIDEKLNEDLAEEIRKPFLFTDRALQIGFFLL